MSRRFARRALIPATVLLGLLTPASASALTATVKVHGNGAVAEIDNRFGDNEGQGGCSYSGTSRTESTVTDCVLGTPSGKWNSGNVVRLSASVPQESYDRGWRFLKWVDASGSGKINCDPQETTGDHMQTWCEFQFGFDNLSIDLYFDDVQGPLDTSITSGPSGTTNQTSATFGFDAASDPGARYECRLDRPGIPGGFFACGNSLDKNESFSNLTANGTYTFYVRSYDPSGNAGTMVGRSWVIDTTPPSPSITGGPVGTVSSATASFTIGTNEGALTCKLDSQAPVGCSPGARNYSGLADGSHTLTVTATDAAQNSTSVARTWTVDTTPPTVTISTGPADGAYVNQKSVGFQFTSSDGTRECSADGGAFGPCDTSFSFTNLSEGEHSLALRARDAVGNTVTVTRTFTVDTLVPDTTLLSGPDEGSTSPTLDATFTFASPESGATFECSLDNAAYTPCLSPLKLTGLTNGDHSFRVRAIDSAGNFDATPPTRSWRVNDLDADADGINRPQDCDDANPAIRPGATDVAEDGIDQDCDGADRVDPDRDRDGVTRPADCDDANAAIRPGAVEVPGNGVDEDCSGADAKVPPVAASLTFRFSVLGARTRMLVLKLSKLARGTRVKITCRGRRCPVKRKSAKPSAKGVVDVRRVLRKKPLRAGVKLTLRVSAPGTMTKVVTFAIRRGKAPRGGKFRCLQPGTKKLGSC